MPAPSELLVHRREVDRFRAPARPWPGRPPGRPLLQLLIVQLRRRAPLQAGLQRQYLVERSRRQLARLGDLPLCTAILVVQRVKIS